MLEIRVNEGASEYYDEEKDEFVYPEPKTYVFEHSLASISKWEALWRKPFLTDKPKTKEESDSYLRCMLVGGDAPDENFPVGIGNAEMQRINDYMNDTPTATWFSERENKKIKSKNNKETVTSELIYYWMISFDIPFECQYWHINRLFTLIRVCGIKENGNGGKMSKKDILRSNSQLNAARKAKYGTRG